MSLMLLLYFVVYAASPVIYSSPRVFGGEKSVTQDKAPQTAGGVHILLLDILFVKMTQTMTRTADLPDKMAEGLSFVRKARAIPSVSNILKRSIGADDVIADRDSVPFPAILTEWVDGANEPGPPGCGFIQAYTGHSPPTA